MDAVLMLYCSDQTFYNEHVATFTLKRTSFALAGGLVDWSVVYFTVNVFKVQPCS